MVEIHQDRRSRFFKGVVFQTYFNPNNSLLIILQISLLSGFTPALNVHAHDATLRNFRDPNDPLRSLIILPVPQPMSSTVTCTLCKKLYVGETGRRLEDGFRDHLRDVEKDDKNASKSVARHFNLPNHSTKHMTVCGLPLHQGSTESRKTQYKNVIFISALLILTVSTNAFHSTNLFCCFSRCQAPTNSVAPYFCI